MPRDKDLGELHFDEESSLWEGAIPFPDARKSAVLALQGEPDGPHGGTRAAVFELKHRYPGLRSAIGGALYDVYSEFRRVAPEAAYAQSFPKIEAPEDIWDTTYLDGIGVFQRAGGAIHIELTYIFDWNDEHLIAVQIGDWEVTGVKLAE